jgi:hypothetical protein
LKWSDFQLSSDIKDSRYSSHVKLQESFQATSCNLPPQQNKCAGDKKYTDNEIGFGVPISGELKDMIL